jgi:DNA polymerase-3 subunit epsilon
MLTDHHSALHDARAAAGLFARYRSAHRELPPPWLEALLFAARLPATQMQAVRGFQPVTRATQQERRAGQRSPLADLVDDLPAGISGDNDAYLSVLDAVLEDRIITAGETEQLTRLAAELGLTRDAAHQAHRDYLGHVSAAAWRDGTVTNSERKDLLEVARLLGVAAAEAESILHDTLTRQGPVVYRDPSRLLQPGDRVVLTGSMDRAQTEMAALATAAGLRVTSSVSRRTALVVAADPYSQSGKAARARELGVRIVAEHVFLDLLAQNDRGVTTAMQAAPAELR